MTQTAIEAPPATRREWLGLALLAVILLRHPHPAAEASGAATRPSDLCPSR
jgi:hypothetical protein